MTSNNILQDVLDDTFTISKGTALHRKANDTLNQLDSLTPASAQSL